MGHRNTLHRLLGLGAALLIAGCSIAAPPENAASLVATTPTAASARATPSPSGVAAVETTPWLASTPISSAEARTSTASQAAASAPTTAAPDPSRLSAKIDVGGYKLQIRCIGEGSPTVVFEAGLGDTGLAWVNGPGQSTPWQATGTFTRACIYDRAGTGDSERGPPPRDSQQIVKELHMLLVNAKIDPPYVLAGHDFGGHIVRLFASKYPDRVAGMVLVDVVHEDQAERYRSVLAMTDKQQERDILFMLGANAEGVNLESSDAQVKAARAAAPIQPIPLIVLSAGRLQLPRGTLEDDRKKALELQRALHEDLASLSPQGKLVFVEQSGHAIQRDQPAVVIDAIHDVVEAARQASADQSSADGIETATVLPTEAETSAIATPSAGAAEVWPTPLPDDLEQLQRLFDYDPQASLEIKESAAREISGIKVTDLSYASPRGGRVPAYLLIPPGAGPFAGIIMLHGQPGQRVDLLEYALDVARTGAVVLLIDAPWNRRAGQIVTFTARDREEQIQLAADLRRGIDLLAAQPQVDSKRIGYVGWGYGAAMGGLLAGVEQRIKAYVLAAGDGGLVEHFTDNNGAVGQLEQVPKEQQEQWIAAMQPIEPIRIVRHAAPAALFFQFTRRDRLAQEDATRFFEAASEPKRIERYNAVNEQMLRDQLGWLAEQIGLDAAAATLTLFEP